MRGSLRVLIAVHNREYWDENKTNIELNWVKDIENKFNIEINLFSVDILNDYFLKQKGGKAEYIPELDNGVKLSWIKL